MIYTPLTKRALRLCFDTHRDQEDRGGLPYVFHPFHLAEQMKDEETVTAALLHDVMEDGCVTREDLEELGVPERVLEALVLLTHREGEPYLEYAVRTCCDPIAMTVKLADMEHNSDLDRLGQITERDLRRVERYETVRELLLDGHPEGGPGEYRSSLLLSEEQQLYLTLVFTREKFLSYEIAARRERPVTCVLDPSGAARLTEAVEEDFLPRFLRAYFRSHELHDFITLLEQKKIFYTQRV